MGVEGGWSTSMEVNSCAKLYTDDCSLLVGVATALTWLVLSTSGEEGRGKKVGGDDDVV